MARLSPQRLIFSFIPLINTLFLLVPSAQADGVGVIGAGKWMYRPACAHACRRVISSNPILCEADEAEGGHSSHHRRHSHDGPTPPECFLKDRVFLRTMALCMAERCPRDGTPVSVMEDYWEGHLATGSVGDWSMKPAMPYSNALMLARDEVKQVGNQSLPLAVSGEPLNRTSWIEEEVYIPYYNGYKYFEIGENGHGRNSLAIAISTVLGPIILSLLRFSPIPALWKSQVNAFLSQPLWGRRLLQPVTGNIGLMPNRGQALFIAYILLTNIFLVVFPYSLKQPNYISDGEHAQLVMIVGDRAGVLAFANFIAIFLFSARNNILLWLTDWSHSTFLLLHRWVAYVCIFHSVTHSILLLYWYTKWADSVAESKLPYWYWGIIATLTICIMWPAALLPVRRRAYELFLAFHKILAALLLIACFLHMWYVFKYNWGYEIWIYAAGGIWFMDQVLRLWRIARNGAQIADITVLDESGEYLKLEIEGVVAEGSVYLYFPTLSWRFWENHPFSVLSSFAGVPAACRSRGSVSKVRTVDDPEKSISPAAIAVRPIQDGITTGAAHSTSSDSSHRSSSSNGHIRPRVTLLVRVQDGITKSLLASGNSQVRVLIESSYRSNPALSNLSSCSTLLCIAGGVGITAVLPVARTFGGVRTRLCWGMRSQTLLQAVGGDIARLGSSVEVETSVGTRLPIEDILTEELVGADEKGEIGVVVCGPAEMADEVTLVVNEIVSSGRSRRGVVLVNEAFSW